MRRLQRRLRQWVLVSGCGLALIAGSSIAPKNAAAEGAAPWAAQLSYEPVALGWSAQEVDRVARSNAAHIVGRGQAVVLSECDTRCQRLHAVYSRLLELARQQSAHAAALSWQLIVVQRADVEAMALPGGQLIVSQAFIDSATAGDEELAFVLAHEMAHSILEHERQALSFARLLLPRQIRRSVRDMYTEMDFNFSLLKAMEPVMQQGEYEADELGLLLASAAGYAPRAQLHYIEREVRSPPTRRPLVATHPAPPDRLNRLVGLLPWAERLHHLSQASTGHQPTADAAWAGDLPVSAWN